MGPLAALTTLEDIAIVSFDIDPAALAAHLPSWLTPDVSTLADGRQRALVSAVTFRDVDFRFWLAPFVQLGMIQTNYRAYVRAGDQRAVWFFGTTLSSPSWRCRAVGETGGYDVELEGTGEPMGRLDGFGSELESAPCLSA